MTIYVAMGISHSSQDAAKTRPPAFVKIRTRRALKMPHATLVLLDAARAVLASSG